MRLHIPFLLLLLAGSPATAQLRPFGEAHAIVGARIEIGDGRVIEKGTILIRNGLIEAVGADLKIPPDAEVLKGDGLIAFPGFIDGWTSKGLKLPDWKPDQDVPPDTGAEASPAMREANRKWIRPELRAFEYLTLTETDAAPLRKAGFTAILIAPSGGLINGTATLVGLSGHPKRESVLKPDAIACLACKLPGGSGFFGGSPGYPATPLGVFSHLRQTMLDAKWQATLIDASKAGSASRPPSDDTLAAIGSILSAEKPVLMEAETENEVIRSVHFADEWRLKPILCGGQEAWKHASVLSQKQVPVILSLKLPDEPKLPGEKPKDEKPKEPGAATKPDDKKVPEDPDADLPLAARKEKKRLWDEKLANAKVLEKAGVPIAFTTRGTKDTSEFWTNLRRIVKEGFPRAAALKALTIQPATLFGLERQLGTVEVGKIANLTIMSADFTDEKAKAKYIFVDGRKFDTEVEPRSPRPAGPQPGEASKESAAR